MQGDPLTGQTHDGSPGAEPRRVHVIRDGLAAHLPDIDPEETAEWLDSFDAVLDAAGVARPRRRRARGGGAPPPPPRGSGPRAAPPGEHPGGPPPLPTPDYVNT